MFKRTIQDGSNTGRVGFQRGGVRKGWVSPLTLGLICAGWIAVPARAQDHEANAPNGAPRTYEDAIVVRYPAELREAERISADLGAIPPAESARAIRNLLARVGGEPEPVPAAGASQEVRIGPSRLAPPEGVDGSLREWLDDPNRPDSFVCILQFDRTPSATEVADVVDLGVVPYCSAGRLVSIARVPAEHVAALIEFPFVRWIGPHTPEYKVSHEDRVAIATGAVPDIVPFFVWPLAKHDSGHSGALTAIGATWVWYDPVPNVYLVQGPVTTFLRAAQLEWVKRVALAKNIAHCQAFEPDDSRELITAPDVWFAFDGSGTRAGILDTGIWAAHPDFANAIAWQYDQNTGLNVAPDDDGHGTHVAGIVAGRGVQLAGTRGAAPGAGLYIIKYSDTALLTADALTRFDNQGVPLVNNSWGVLVNGQWFYGYDDTAEIVDAYADDQGMTLVFSAGNQGALGPGHITDPGVAKNVITVGAVSYTVEGDSTPNGVARVTWYSSRGPTQDDSRLKPEVVAPGGDTGNTGCPNQDYGFGVVSTNAQDTLGNWLDCIGNRWGPNPPQSFYTRMCGTSMAAPHVTGVASLLYQAYGWMFGGDDGLVSRDIKALLVANAIPIHNYGTQAANGYANTDTGYGLVDAYHTLFNVPTEKLTLLWGHGAVIENTQNTQDWQFTVGSTAKQLVVVMCYEDDEGEQNNANALRDDLDLTLIAPNSTQFTFTLPAGVAVESPLEKIVVANPSSYGTGQWTARITGASWDDPLDPAESQRYTIVATAYFVDPYDPRIDLQTNEQLNVAPGATFSVQATIKNLNGLTAAGLTAELTGDGSFGGELNTTKLLGDVIGKNSTKAVQFGGLTAPQTLGDYWLTLIAAGANRGLDSVVRNIRVRVTEDVEPGPGPRGDLDLAGERRADGAAQRQHSDPVQ